MVVLGFLLLLLIGCFAPFNGIVVENISDPSSFACGNFYYSTPNLHTLHNTLIECIKDELVVHNVLLLYTSRVGLDLTLLAAFSVYSQKSFEISHALNSCAIEKPKQLKEIYFHLALVVFPYNSHVAKNLAFIYEWDGWNGAATNLLATGALLTGDTALHLSAAFVSPPFYWSIAHSLQQHRLLLQRARELLDDSHYNMGLDPMADIREMQLNPQYIGYATNYVSSMYGAVLRHLYNSYFMDAPPAQTASGQRLRLGIVSEHISNSSPGLCIQDILERISAFSCESVSPCREIDIIFFDRTNLNTQFAAVMRDIATEVIEVDQFNCNASARLIREANVDILLYIALPTEKFTVLLSHMRLAPIQISFGIGHPITSGSSAIDFNIIATPMISNYSDVTHGTEDDILSFGSSIHMYTEQIMLLDSIGYYMSDPLLLYDDMKQWVDDLIVGELNCREVDELMSSLGLPLRAASLVTSCASADAPQLHLYSCIQIIKKMHPVFDKILFGILEHDPSAIILLSHSAQDLLPRWELSFPHLFPAAYSQLIFMPRLPHYDYLRLLSLSHVFLNTIPFGSGITSSEAIAVCVPVVTLPSHTSVLQLALGQIRQLGDDVATMLIATSIDDYISRAIGLASNVDIKLMMHDRKMRLFGEEALSAAAMEWFAVLQRLLPHAS